MERRRFLVWSFVGALLWVLSITLLGYNLGRRVPWLRDNIDYAVLAILALSAVPIVFEWWRRRRHEDSEEPAGSATGDPAVDETQTSEAQS
jgi:membrane-associated protein